MKWKFAPEVGNIGSEATIPLSADVAFLGAADTSRFLELNENLPCTNCNALVARTLGWFAIFSFEPSGYVKDDETIDPDELLKTLKEKKCRKHRAKTATWLAAFVSGRLVYTPSL